MMKDNHEYECIGDDETVLKDLLNLYNNDLLDNTLDQALNTDDHEFAHNPTEIVQSPKQGGSQLSDELPARDTTISTQNPRQSSTAFDVPSKSSSEKALDEKSQLPEDVLSTTER